MQTSICPWPPQYCLYGSNTLRLLQQQFFAWLQSFMQKCQNISFQVLSCFAIGLGFEEDFFTKVALRSVTLYSVTPYAAELCFAWILNDGNYEQWPWVWKRLFSQVESTSKWQEACLQACYVILPRPWSEPTAPTWLIHFILNVCRASLAWACRKTSSPRWEANHILGFHLMDSPDVAMSAT